MGSGHGGKREGAGRPGYRSKDERVLVRMPKEYVESVKQYLEWLDERTYPEVRRELPDLATFLSQLPDNTDL